LTEYVGWLAATIIAIASSSDRRGADVSSSTLRVGQHAPCHRMILRHFGTVSAILGSYALKHSANAAILV